MPTEDYQSSPDERQDQTPTAEELQAAELAKTKQALLVAAAMQQTESQLANRLPTQTAPVQPPPTPVAPPPAPPPPAQMQPPSPVQPPTMPVEATPPMLTSPERIARVQQGGQQVQRPLQSTLSESISPPKESQNRYPIKQMLNMGMKPKDIMATVDAARRYDAQRGYQADLAKGIPTQDALAKWGPMLFSGSKGAATSSMVRPMTEYQQSMADHRKALEAQAAKKVVPTPRNMVLERAISDEHAALNKTRADLAKTPAKDGTDPRIHEAFYHVKKLAELNSQHQQAQPSAASSVQSPVPVQPPAQSRGTLTRSKAQEFLSQANGDKSKARQLARDAGYEL